MVKSFELADIAGFYRAFGVEITPGTERPDHIAVELEFMHLLAVKEVVAAGREDGGEHARICRDARATFFRDHLGRWFGPSANASGEGGPCTARRRGARRIPFPGGTVGSLNQAA
jgi:TorA maturation chaperone TorD